MKRLRDTWRVLKPRRDDWLDQAPGVLIVLVWVLCYLLGARPGLVIACMAGFTLSNLHLRMVDRRILRERQEIVEQALKVSREATIRYRSAVLSQLGRRSVN